MPQIQGVVESVVGNPGANGRTRYATVIGGQEYNTWKPEIARVANEHLGQQVTANVTVKPSQDGQYMNYYLDGILDGAGQVPGQIPMAGGQQGGVPMQPQIPVQPGIPMAAPAARGMDPQREARIVKQSSMATAFNFVGHLFDGAGPEAMEEAEQAALGLAKRLYVQVLGAPQTLDDEIVEGLVSQAPEQPAGDEPETW